MVPKSMSSTPIGDGHRFSDKTMRTRERPRGSSLPLLFALTIAALDAAHAADGDFGRPRPSFLSGIVAPQFWKGPVTGYSTYPLTDAETELRDRAYTLIRPTEPRVAFDVVIARYRIAQVFPPTAANFDPTAYGRNVLWMPGRSEVSQYNQLIDDMTGDGQLIGPFAALACHVADLDGKRARSLRYVAELTEEQREDALGRILENRGTILWVRDALHQRIASYRYALEHLVIAVPSRRAIEVERTLRAFGAAVAAADAPLTRCAGEVGAAPVPIVTK
jgi:hypothetical protein